MIAARIENYLPEAIDISNSDGITVHFAETHDNPRLASRSKTMPACARPCVRFFLDQGAYGFANGVEWYAAEKINVHNSASLNWGAQTNQVDLIRRLNHLLRAHPVFLTETEGKCSRKMAATMSSCCVAIYRRADHYWWPSISMMKIRPLLHGTRRPQE